MPKTQLKCLTIRQPWASLLVTGTKKMEGRSWKTTYRGKVWIHAGLAIPSTSDLNRAKELYPGRVPKLLPRGKIIGCVNLCRIIDKESYVAEYGQNDCDYKNVWICEEPRQLVQPVEYTGALGLCKFDRILSPY